MTSTTLMILIGLAPVTALFLVLSFVQKKHRPRNVIAFFCLLACMGGSFLFAGLLPASRATSASAQSVSENSEEKTNRLLPFVYQMLKQSDESHAKEVLSDLCATEPVTLETSLAMARLCFLEGRIDCAQTIYAKLPDSEEKTLVFAVNRTEGTTSTGYVAARSSIEGSMDSELSESKNSADYEKAIELANQANEAYERYLAGEPVIGEEATDGTKSEEDSTDGIVVPLSFDEDSTAGIVVPLSLEGNDALGLSGNEDPLVREALEKDLKKLTKLTEECDELASVGFVRESKVKLSLMLEDYKGFAENLDNNAGYEELMVGSELYWNGLVKERDFDRLFGDSGKPDYAPLIGAMEDAYRVGYAGESGEEKKAAKVQIAELKALEKDPVRYQLTDLLSTYSEMPELSDRSKIYLQMAKLSSEQEESTDTNHYVDRSLQTVGICEDEAFTEPMNALISVISDKDATERLKEVPQYTQSIIDNAMPIQVPTAVKTKVQGEDEGTAPTVKFDQKLNTYVSQKRVAINIVSIDASEFDTVHAKLSVNGEMEDSVTALKDKLRVTDCELNIEDFTLEKVKYEGMNILICADVSGSMEGSMGDLIDAITYFVQSAESDESIALVTFSSGVESTLQFGSTNEELIALASSLTANGGTNMYDAVLSSLSLFPADSTSIDYVILLSDGDDNYPHSSADIAQNVNEPYRNKEVVLYSIGLGSSVNSTYLSSFSDGTGGKYVYASSPEQLEEFFIGLRAQVKNSYQLTYHAKDSFQTLRTLRVEVKEEDYTYDEKTYTLRDGSDIVITEENEHVLISEKAVSGLKQRLLFFSNLSQDVLFLGSGFEASDVFTLTLVGKERSVNLSTIYMNSDSIKVRIPGNTPCGVYDLEVKVNAQKTILRSHLVIAKQGDEQTIQFGDYTFTAYQVEQKDNMTEMTGYVKMNDWLNFNGTVQLIGDLEGDSVVMQTSGEEYVHYTDTASGLAVFLKNKNLVLPELPDMTLWRQINMATGEQRMEASYLPIPLIGMFQIAAPGLFLYPDRIELSSSEFSTKLPFQDDILQATGLFTFSAELKGSVSANAVDLEAEVSGNAGEKDGRFAGTKANLGNLPILMDTGEAELKFSTKDKLFYVKYIAKIPLLSDDDELGASLQWKWGNEDNPGIHLDELMIYADFDINIKGSPIDLTLSDFRLGGRNMTSKYATLDGGCSISAYKVGSVLPGIGKYLGELADVSLISADDTELSLGLNHLFIGAKTELHVLKYLEVGKVSLKLGQFQYSNRLLGLTDEDVIGLSGKVTAGPAIHTKNCDITLQGSIELDATNRFCGVAVDGDMQFDVKWWVFKKSVEKSGAGAVGLMKTHDNDLVFVVRASDGKKMTTIEWSKKEGKKYESKKL